MSSMHVLWMWHHSATLLSGCCGVTAPSHIDALKPAVPTACCAVQVQVQVALTQLPPLALQCVPGFTNASTTEAMVAPSASELDAGDTAAVTVLPKVGMMS